MRISLALAGLTLILLGSPGCSKEPAKTNEPVTAAGGTKLIDPSQATLMSPAELATKADISLYPNAQTPDGKSNLRTANGTTRYEIVMTSSDSADKVLKFYEGKLKGAERIGTDAKLMGMTPKGNYVSVVTEAKDGKTNITLVVNAES